MRMITVSRETVAITDVMKVAMRQSTSPRHPIGRTFRPIALAVRFIGPQVETVARQQTPRSAIANSEPHLALHCYGIRLNRKRVGVHRLARRRRA